MRINPIGFYGVSFGANIPNDSNNSNLNNIPEDSFEKTSKIDKEKEQTLFNAKINGLYSEAKDLFFLASTTVSDVSNLINHTLRSTKYPYHTFCPYGEVRVETGIDNDERLICAIYDDSVENEKKLIFETADDGSVFTVYTYFSGKNSPGSIIRLKTSDNDNVLSVYDTKTHNMYRQNGSITEIFVNSKTTNEEFQADEYFSFYDNQFLNYQSNYKQSVKPRGNYENK